MSESATPTPAAEPDFKVELETFVSERPFDQLSTSISELVIGLVGPLGTDNGKIRGYLIDRLRSFSYDGIPVHLSKTVIPALARSPIDPLASEYDRAKRRIEQGNEVCERFRNRGVLASAAAAEIARTRATRRNSIDRVAYIVSSLKRPEEVEELRTIYGRGFFLIAVHSEAARRVERLVIRGTGMERWEAQQLVERDEHEPHQYGQNTRDTFHLADFFVADEGNDDKLRNSLNRCVDLIFGHPHLTPTFDEFAMFMAFASSLRSADLSRQVGAVIARRSEILASGANDCPAPAGGLYWAELIGNTVDDRPRGRDYKRGFDSNTAEKRALMQEISEATARASRDRMAEELKASALADPNEHSRILDALATGCREAVGDILRKSRLADITEYGRVVHAEMEALLACARSNVSCVGATIFCTTFPCHNCAKHIIAAGIERVIYVEPYPKSKAFKFHDDAVTSDKKCESERRVQFVPFIGVGARRFFDLFSMSLGDGRIIKRKDQNGLALSWSPSTQSPRVPLLPVSYRQIEEAAVQYIKAIEKP